jgi:hypothetical protein
MKNDSVLKKEFKQRDVQRLRNLVQGKYGEKYYYGNRLYKNKRIPLKETNGKKMVEHGLLKMA